MKITFTLNDTIVTWPINPGNTLLSLLRQQGYHSVKSGGCGKGECGACSVIMDGKLINSCMILAAQVGGHVIQTVDKLGEYPQQGWKTNKGLSAVQQAFVDVGAIQCGYCTPAMVLAGETLLTKGKDPTDDQIREALSGILCRCTGYIKPVQAIQRAAAQLRGEVVPTITRNSQDNHAENSGKIMPQMWTMGTEHARFQVGKPEPKVDGTKLVQGNPAFTSDIEIRDLLIAKVLHSPVAHAIIKHIDASKARSLPGVACVLTWQDIPRVIYSTAGQSDPIPGPLDSFSLDQKVRFVGDRVALVAAESEEIANEAIKLIEVDYEPLAVVLDPAEAMQKGTVKIHDESEYINFADSDPNKNLAAKIRIDIGNVEKGFQEADFIFEGDYEVPKVQQAHIEPHVAITYWDEDDRMVIRTSTQVPFHVRRILSPVLNIPIKRIRVIKPRIGGGFGGKQEVLIEDIAAHLTIATGRPVKIEYTREEEFIAARSRHPMRIHMKTGVKKDGTITANEMYCLSDTGAYGSHALTVTGNTGHKSMALYVGDGEYRKNPNIRFYADIVYTNHPPAGAYRGYGVPQGFFALERHIEKIARKLGMDSLEFRAKNSIREGELQPFSTSWSEGREPKPETIHTVGLDECVRRGKEAIEWDQKYKNLGWRQNTGKPYLRRGIGVATVMQGTAIPYLDMGGASLKINEDGSFNLLIGATDLGTGSDTVLAQMAAEVLGVPVEDIIVYSSDTDFTPFDKGAYASSTTYISGTAVTRAAEIVAERIRVRAARIMNAQGNYPPLSPDDIYLENRKAANHIDQRFVSIEEIARNALHKEDQEQIMGVASYFSPLAPPPFAAQFAEVSVDIETGQVHVDKLVMAVDSGVIVNPITASGQIEGGMTQALGYAVCEEMQYDDQGRPIERDLGDYHIFRANEMPDLTTMFIETYEPSHPFGVKATAEIPMDGVAPAVANAILDACGAQIDIAPATPERIWDAIQRMKSHQSDGAQV